MSGLLDGKQLKDKSVPAEKLKDTYLPVGGGTITGDLTVLGNTVLSERATYKGSEIATEVDLYDDTHLKERIEELEERKAGKDEIITRTDGMGDKFLSDDGNYKTVVENLAIDPADRLLTGESGLKANLSVEVKGNDIRILGKNDPEGNPLVVARFNVLPSQLIDRVEVVEEHLFITFIVNNEGIPGTETVDIDLSGFIDIYTGSNYVDVENNIISLDYNALHDRLINDGFAQQTDIPQVPSKLPSPKAVTFSGAATAAYNGSVPVTVHIPATDLSGYVPASRTVWGKPLTTNVTGDMTHVGNISPATTNTYDIGSSTLRYKDLYLYNGGFTGAVTATGGFTGNATTTTTAGRVQNNLTFTGAVSKTYNGSAPVTVELPKNRFLPFYSFFLGHDGKVFWDTVDSYEDNIPLYVVSSGEDEDKGLYPVISGIKKQLPDYVFTIITRAVYGRLYISYVGARSDASYYTGKNILELTPLVTDTLQNPVSTSLLETVTSPTRIELGETTDLWYENRERKTGTLKISGGLNRKEYQLTVYNNSENNYTLSLPFGDEYVTNSIQKVSIPAGHICKMSIRHLFGKYFIRTI